MTPDYTEMCPEDCRDLWIAVLRLSLEDYWRGIRKRQHLKLYVIRVRHHGRRDQEDFQSWLSAAHWLLSQDTSKRSFLWLAKQLRLDPDDVYSRMKNPPERRTHPGGPMSIEKRAGEANHGYRHPQHFARPPQPIRIREYAYPECCLRGRF